MRQHSQRLDIVRRSKLVLTCARLLQMPSHHLLGSADAIILDLRDALDGGPLSLLAEVSQRLASLAGKGLDLFIRAPLEALPLALERLEGVRLDGVALLTPGPEAVQEADRILARYDALASTPLQIDLVVDSPAVLLCLYEVATASPRVVSLTLDEMRLQNTIGVASCQEVDQFFYPRGLALLAARLAEIQAHGLAFLPPHPDGSPPSLEERAVAARKLGLMGALCASPEEAVALNKGFTPPPQEVEWCRKALWVLEEALRHGLGSATIEGREMVDIAMLKHIRNLLQREAAICRKDAQKALALGE